MVRGELTIGTRGSRLALWQAENVRSSLPVPARIEVIRTSGDVQADVPLQGRSTTGFFTREIEHALTEGRIDLAVHSLKDLPTEQPRGLVLGALLERHDPSDVLLVRPEALDASRPFPLASGARVGAGSLRRRHTLLALRPDLEAALVRGNVPTRVRKTVEGVVDAIVLARAGLERLALDPAPLAAFALEPSRWIPAPGQGVVAVEIREDDAAARGAVAELDHARTRVCVELERRLLELAGGGCHAPFAAWARFAGGDALAVDVGAPAPDGAWRELSVAGSAQDVEEAARRWFERSCPPQGGDVSEEGVCRRIRQWC